MDEPAEATGEPPTTIVTCEGCGAVQSIEDVARGLTCASCGDTFYFLRCPGCSLPMQWRAGARRQVHDACGRVVKLSRKFRPPPVARGELVDVGTPWWRLPGSGLPFDLGRADFLGGHSLCRAEVRDATVEMQAEQMRVSFGMRAFVVPWSTVRAVHADTRTRLGDRPTVVRMADARLINLARERPAAASYLVVETEGEALVFAFAIPHTELETRCLGLVSGEADRELPAGARAPEPGATGDDDAETSVLDRAPDAVGERAREPAEVLRELAALHAEGVLSDDEFAQKKAEILRRM